MKDLLTIIDENQGTCFDSYKRIAEKLMNGYVLQVRRKLYRIVDCEFYYHSKNHEDPYVHGHERQKESTGEWYFHGSGLDITLSNGESYGGILIRGIAEIKSPAPPERADAIIGPLNVCTEIFKQIGSVVNEEPVKFCLVDMTGDLMFMRPTQIFSVPRVGLNGTLHNDNDYCNRPYRFLTFLHLPHRETEKVKKYITEVAKVIDIDQYKKYYNFKPNDQ